MEAEIGDKGECHGKSLRPKLKLLLIILII